MNYFDEENFSGKKQLFLPFWTLGETLAVFWQNVSHRILELRFKRPEKHFQRENQKNEAIVPILWILSEIYLLKNSTSLSSFQSTGLNEHFQEKNFWKYNLNFFNLLGFQTTFPIARFEKFSSGMTTLHSLIRDDFLRKHFFLNKLLLILTLSDSDWRIWTILDSGRKKMQPSGEIFQVDLSKLHSRCPKEYSLEKLFESKEYFFEHFGIWKNFFLSSGGRFSSGLTTFHSVCSGD